MARIPHRNTKLNTQDFSALMRSHRIVRSSHFRFLYRQSDCPHARLGIALSRRVAPRAVARNYMRRVIRAWFYYEYAKLPLVDVLIIPHKPFGRKEFTLMNSQLNALVAKL